MNETQWMLEKQNEASAPLTQDENQERRPKELREQEWAMSQNLLAAGRALLNRLVKNPKLDPAVPDITGLLELASKLGRLSIGLETGHTEVTAQVAMSFRLEVDASIKRVFTHYTVFLLACRDGDGNIFVVDEHAERQWLPERHVTAIKNLLARHRVAEKVSPKVDQYGRPILWRPTRPELRRTFAGADVFAKQSDGTSVADQYARLGLRLQPANMDRINGWAEIHRRLGDPEAGIPPTLFIHQRCARLLETLPALQHDPNRVEDVLKIDPDEDGIGGDDAADTLRYLITSKIPTVQVLKLRGL